MRVLLLPSWYPEPGQVNGIFFHERALALQKQGVQIIVGVCDVSLRKQGAWGFSETVQDGIPILRMHCRNYTPFWERGMQRQKRKPLQQIYQKCVSQFGAPDLIHMDSARTAEAVLPLVQETKRPLTYTEHYSKILAAKKGSYLKRVAESASAKADHCFYISQFVKEQLQLPDDHSSYLPNSVDFSHFTLASKENHGIFHFKALGGLRKVKGYDRLLRAFAEVHQRHPATRLTIGGTGPEKDALLLLRESLQLQDSVHFSGEIAPHEKQNFYQDADAFICSSDLETFSVVLIEALASGLPVIATRCGGPEDFVTKENGILVERSAADLGKGMETMLQTNNDYDSKQIRDFAQAKFDQDSVAKEQIRIWETLLGN